MKENKQMFPKGFYKWQLIIYMGIIFSIIFTGPLFALPRLKVSTDGHFLIKDDGNNTPFVWIGDTGWVIRNLNPSEVDHYLHNRAQKKFSIIQVMAIRTHLRTNNGLENYNGDHPFSSMDPVILNEAYWKHMDYIVNKTEELGMYIILFTMWGRNADDLFPNPIENNYQYGKLLGERYKNKNHVLWAVSGEYEKIEDNWRKDPDINAEQKALLVRIAQGLEDGHGGNNLMTVHPIFTSSKDFHNEEWLDFNMQQTWGHVTPNIDRIKKDYDRIPIKPVLNGEPGYENREDGWPCPAWHLRVEGYLSMFSGAFGFTYGAHHIWQMDSQWKDSLDYEGAFDMQHLGALIRSRPVLIRIPDQTIITSPIGSKDKSNPTALAATRASDKSYVFVYSSQRRNFTVDMSKISGNSAKAWWYNPRDGKCYDNSNKYTESPFGIFNTNGIRDFTPPGTAGKNNDWVLVLDDISKDFLTPGILPDQTRNR
jgi:hypothetical protein